MPSKRRFHHPPNEEIIVPVEPRGWHDRYAMDLISSAATLVSTIPPPQ